MTPRLAALHLVWLFALACHPSNPPVGPPLGLGLGASCADGIKCRAGFTCGVDGRLAFVGPRVDTLELTLANSASGNVTMPRTITAAARQYAPVGYDGHFVVSNTTETTDASRFIARVLRREVPTTPEP